MLVNEINMNEQLEQLMNTVSDIQEQFESFKSDNGSSSGTPNTLDRGGIFKPVTPHDKDAIRSVVSGTPPNTQILTSTTTLVPEVESFSFIVITALANALTISNQTQNTFNGQKLLIRIKDNGSARALSFGSEYRATTAALPTTTTASKAMYLGFIRNSQDTKWDLLAVTSVA